MTEPTPAVTPWTTHLEAMDAAIGRARLVIAQVNPELPWTYGDTVIEPGVR